MTASMWHWWKSVVLRRNARQSQSCRALGAGPGVGRLVTSKWSLLLLEASTHSKKPWAERYGSAPWLTPQKCPPLPRTVEGMLFSVTQPAWPLWACSSACFVGQRSQSNAIPYQPSRWTEQLPLSREIGVPPGSAGKGFLWGHHMWRAWRCRAFWGWERLQQSQGEPRGNEHQDRGMGLPGGRPGPAVADSWQQAWRWRWAKLRQRHGVNPCEWLRDALWNNACSDH